jgi:hypothetical protein
MEQRGVMTDRQCTKCGNWKAISEFHADSRKRDGLDTRCKACVNAKRRQQTQERPGMHAARGRRQRASDPERAREIQRKAYRKNREANLERGRRYRKANSKKRVEYNRQWVAANYERAKEYIRNWRKAHPEKSKEYARRYLSDPENRAKKYERNRQREAQNPDQRRVILQRRLARKKALISQLTTSQWKWLKKQSDHRCVYCGRHESEAGTLQQEHVIPVIQGGHFTVSNIVPACGTCNLRKGGRTPVQAGMEPVIKIDVLKKMKQESMF